MNKVKGILELSVGATWFSVFEKGGVKNPQIEQLVDVANEYYKAGNFEESVKYYKQAIKIFDVAPLYNNLGIIYIQMDDLGKAANAFQQALKLDGASAHSLYNLAIVMYSSGHFDRAIEFLSHIIGWKDVPPSMLINAHNDTGCAYMRSGKLEEAQKSFDAAIVLDQKFEKSLLNLGNLYCEQEKFAESIKQFNAVLALRPDNAAAYNGIGVVYFNQDKLQDAKEYFEKAIHASPPCRAAKINQHIMKQLATSK